MAEAFLRKMLEDLGEKTKGIRVISAGTAALKGQKVSPNAISVMQEKNIEINSHRATPLSQELIGEADLILSMTRNHKEQVLKMDSNAIHKTYTLKEYGSRLGDYEEIVEEIEKLQRIIKKKKNAFYEEYEKEIIDLRNQRYEWMSKLQGVEDRIRELEMHMGRKVENEQREVVYLEDKLPCVDILDPFGQPTYVYRECAKEIEEALKVVVKKIME